MAVTRAKHWVLSMYPHQGAEAVLTKESGKEKTPSRGRKCRATTEVCGPRGIVKNTEC